MPRYWRDPDTMTVHQYRGDPDENMVIVIPAEKWLEIVKYLKGVRPVGTEEVRIDAIIAEVGE